LLRVSDLASLAALAREHGALLAVDNLREPGAAAATGA
jgi:cystathionine beta-lyase/cystathionine gamma-synthase